MQSIELLFGTLFQYICMKIFIQIYSTVLFISFIKTPNNHNNDLTNGEYNYNTEGKPLNMKEGNPALVGR